MRARRLPSGPPSRATRARAGIVALLRLATADADMLELEAWLREAAERMARQRADIVKILGLIDGARQTLTHGLGGTPWLRHHRERLRRHEAAYAVAMSGLQKDAAAASDAAAELQRRRVEVDELRSEVVREVSRAVLEQYQTAVLAGRAPAVTGLRDGSCGGCRRRLPPEVAEEVRDGQGVAACPRCLRLLYNAAWLERDFRSATMPPGARHEP